MDGPFPYVKNHNFKGNWIRVYRFRSFLIHARKNAAFFAQIRRITFCYPVDMRNDPPERSMRSVITGKYAKFVQRRPFYFLEKINHIIGIAWQLPNHVGTVFVSTKIEA